MRRIILFLLLVCFGVGAAQAQSGKRVALLIGNSDYASQSTLSNPRNDVRLVAESAKKAGFQTVTVKQDLGVRELQQALRDFRSRADGAEVAMVYYAGHGMEGNGRNWLIPTDATLNSDRDLPYEAINLDQVMETIEGATLRMVVLDACRNNPFGRSWRAGSRAVGRGLAGIEADDVLVIYAAAPGQVAADGEGGNSPFATALAKRLAEPGLPVQLLGGVVRDDVLTATGGNQRPFVSASITGTAFYLVQAKTVNIVNAVPATASVAAPAPVDPLALDLAMWNGALAAGTVAAYQEYLYSNPKGRFRVLAEQNIGKLNMGHAEAAKPKQESAQLAALDEGAQKLTKIVSCGRSGTSFVLTNAEEIKFEFNSGELDPISYKNLDFIASCLKKDPRGVIEITGHTDSSGAEMYNEILSKRRATSVASYLIGLGIQSSRFDVVGQGERYPMASNDVEQGRALNNRIEIRVLDE